MDNRVFYGLLGVIAAVWVGLYIVLVQEGKSAAKEAQADLSSHETSARRYAKAQPEELPTAALRAQVAREAEQISASVEHMRDYFRGRDARFERYLGGAERPTTGQWRTAYKDVFTALKDDYENHAKKLRVVVLDDAGKPIADRDAGQLPFTQQKTDSINSETQLPAAQRRWSVMEAVVRGVMKHGGTLRRVSIRDAARAGRGAGARRSSKDAPERPDFGTLPVDIEAYLPPGRVNGYVRQLLTHPSVTFELDSLEISKQMSRLQLKRVEMVRVAEGNEEALPSDPAREPMVAVMLRLEVLDYREPARVRGSQK